MKRLAVILAVLLVFAGTSLAGLYFMLSPAFLTAEIANSVAKATGKAVTFSTSPRLTVWPEPGVIFRGVRFSNSGGRDDEPFADIEKMVVKISARALIDRRVDIEEIRLFDPKLNLIVDGEGRSNWTMAPMATGGGEATVQDAANPLGLPPIYVEGGIVAFNDRRSGQSFSLRRLDLVLRLGSVEGPVEVKGSGDWQSDRVSFSLFIKSPQLLAGKGSPLDLNLSGSWLNLAFNGRASIAKEFDLAGTVQGNARSMRGLMRWARFDIGDGKGLGTFHTTGALRLKGKILSFTKAQFSLDGMRAQGEASLSFGASKPKLSAELGIDQLDLKHYLMANGGSSADAEEGIESWSNAPVDFSLLKSIDVKAVLRAKRLTYGHAVTTDAVIDATVSNGVLNAKLQQMEMYGGRGQGQLVLNGAQKVPTLQLGFEGKGFDGHRLLRDLCNFSRIEGQTELAIAVAATGRNEREMIASLRGTAGLKFTDGAVKGINLAKMMESISRKVLSGWIPAERETTAFQLLKANFKVSDGIAQSDDLELVGSSMRLRGNGLADLLKREVDFKIESDSMGDPAGGSSVAVPIVVKGPWVKPKFYPDIAGVLENPQAAYETLKMLIGKTTLEKFEEAVTGKGENAGRIAGEELSNGADRGTGAGAVDLIKKQLHKDTLELMNGFTNANPPEPVTSEP
jgi:AsmA protein